MNSGNLRFDIFASTSGLRHHHMDTLIDWPNTINFLAVIVPWMYGLNYKFTVRSLVFKEIDFLHGLREANMWISRCRYQKQMKFPKFCLSELDSNWYLKTSFFGSISCHVPALYNTMSNKLVSILLISSSIDYKTFDTVRIGGIERRLSNMVR